MKPKRLFCRDRGIKSESELMRKAIARYIYKGKNMDILGLNVTSISIIELLKILLTVLDALAGGGTRSSQQTVITGSDYSGKCGAFAEDLYGRTLNFLKSNLKREDLLQISDKINWEKNESLKQEQPKPSQSLGHAR